jgi:hypothetical protein
MSTVINPNGANFPTGLTVPSDGDTPIRASDVIVPVQGVYDRTEANKLRIDALTRSLLQLGSRNAIGTGGGKVIYSQADGAFWAVGGASAGSDIIRHSTDRTAWQNVTLSSSISQPFLDLDVDGSGNLVVGASGASQVMDIARSGFFPASTATLRVLYTGTATSSVVFDPVRARWCVAGNDTIGGQKVFHSTNRSSWTAATSPFTGSQRPRLWVNKVSGRIVGMNTNGTSTINIATSDDGGQTWTARAAVTTAATTVQSTHIDMAYGATDGVWLMAVTNTASFTEIWRSTDDGTSWTLRTTITGGTVVQGSGLTVIGSIWCAFRVLGTTGIGLIYSEDQGLTWRYSGWRPVGSVAEAWLAAGDGGLAFSGTVASTGILYTSNVRTGLFGTVI